MNLKTEKTKQRTPDGRTKYYLTIDDRVYGPDVDAPLVTLAEFLAEVRRAYPEVPDAQLGIAAVVELDYDDIESTGIGIGHLADKELPTDAEFIDVRLKEEAERAAELAERQKQNDEADRLSQEFDPFDEK